MRILPLLLLTTLLCPPLHAKQKKTCDQKGREDREKVNTEGLWI